MSSASIKKIIPCKKKDLIKMVLDIEKYPEFVPWCLEGKIHEKNESDDLIEIKGDLKVGKRFLNETYTSLVLYYKEKTDVASIEKAISSIGYQANTVVADPVAYEALPACCKIGGMEKM